MSKPRLFTAVVLLLALAAAAGPAQPKAGSVTVAYTLHRIPKMGSNQIALWIEDAQGGYVRTLFATDYMARRQGFRKRPQCCPLWVQTSGLERLSSKELDAVSGATQAPGAYLYKIEGNLYIDKRVLWTGSIQVGGGHVIAPAREVMKNAPLENIVALLETIVAERATAHGL